MDVAYRKLTVRRGDHFFLLFCTLETLQHRLDDVMQWVDQLASKLRFTHYETQVSIATEAEATERPYALFEHTAISDKKARALQRA